MNIDLTQKAIALALDANWQEAIKVNKEILKEYPNDCDSLNRLAFAYSELGNYPHARKYAKKVLKLSPFDKIAEKALKKWKNQKKGDIHENKIVSTDTFIEEPGKTKIFNLINLGTENTLANLYSGDEVIFNPQGHKLSVLTSEGKYLGRLPDNIGCRIKKLINLGKEYQIFIKSIKTNEIKIFVRETQCSEKASKIPSFPPEKSLNFPGRSTVNEDSLNL